ncbi:MAG: TolC family protein [Gemmatimonadaceae bacterium]|nr:TolC family protein [Gemmatimonadaceae bacterium]
MPRSPVLLLAALVALPGLARAQAAPTAPVAPLSLADALREADGHAFGNRLAAAATDQRRAGARLPLKGILPSARVESGLVRTTDPIGAFGATLRQRSISAANFDPARLNAPAPVSTVQGALVVEMPFFNADAWLGRRAARAAVSATESGGAWTASTIRADVVRAWFGALLADEKVRTLDAAQQAAHAATQQVESMVRQGVVTKADALQASVHELDLTAQRLAAADAAVTARAALGMLLGRSTQAAPAITGALPSDSALRAFAARDTGPAAGATQRTDVRAALDGVQAASVDLQRAQSAFLPRLNGFARSDWFTPSTPFGGKASWTLGVMASWSLPSMGGELAEVQAARARSRSASAGRDAALAQARLESDATQRALTVALLRLDLAAQAGVQAREAQRLVARRYAGGLATVAELLGATAGATQSTLAHAAARFAVIDAIAARRLAIGADPGALASLVATP